MLVGLLRLVYTYGLLTIPLYPNTTKTLTSNLSSYSPYFYYMTVQIGSFNQNKSLLLDTSTSWLLLNPYTNTTDGFSSTLHCSVLEKTVNYSGISMTGNVCSENLQISGSFIRNQNILMLKKNYFENFDGVLGLALSSLSDGYLPLYENTRNFSKEQTFSIYIGKLNETNNGVFTLAGSDDDYGVGPEKRIPILQNTGHWLFKINSILVDNTQINLKQLGYFDSTQPALSLTKKFYTKISQIIISEFTCTKSLYIKCECSDPQAFPNLTFMINKENFTITPQNYVINDSTSCLLLLTENSFEYNILGLPFFYEYYLVFSLDTMTVLASRSVPSSALSKFSILYIIGVVVVIIIIAIPICFYSMLSKIKGVPEGPIDYDRIH